MRWILDCGSGWSQRVRLVGQQSSSSITAISLQACWAFMPWPVWLIYDLYPSLEAVAVALSGFDGGWVLMVLGNMCSLHNNMFLSLVWLVSQHEGILLYLIIKSIKATSMLERLHSSWLWLHGGGCTVCWYLLSLPPCSPRMSDVHFIVHLQIYHGGEILLISSFES